MTCRFGVVATDSRRSSVWSVWSNGSDVYVAPRMKGGDFKISLHKSGVWRIAFDKNYAERMRELGTGSNDRCIERLRRPPENAQGLTRAVRMYFPDSDLRGFVDQGWEESKPIEKIAAPPQDGLRVIDLLFTSSRSKFGEADWPLRGSLQAEKIGSWKLPNGDILWLVHFVLSGNRGLRDEAELFRNLLRVKRDDRQSVKDSSRRIMISGVNNQGWFCVIDAAAF